jgi:hypothetical protein
MSDLTDLSAMLKDIAKEVEHDENSSMEELIKDLIMFSAGEGIAGTNQNSRIDKIISIVSAREV